MRGREFFESIRSMPPTPAREARLVDALLDGGLLAWPFVAVRLPGGRGEFYAAADYVALGEPADFVRVPLGAGGCQRVADDRKMVLPTARMVDLIWAASRERLSPQPMTPNGADMLSIAWWVRHNDMIEAQRRQKNFELGRLLAGHKKDVVLDNRLVERPDRVAIYGWQRPNGVPIQPLSTKHEARYADYSHGCRLCLPRMILDGRERDVVEVWQSDDAQVLTGGAALRLTRYPGTSAAAATTATTTTPGSRVAFAFVDGGRVSHPGQIDASGNRGTMTIELAGERFTAPFTLYREAAGAPKPGALAGKLTNVIREFSYALLHAFSRVWGASYGAKVDITIQGRRILASFQEHPADAGIRHPHPGVTLFELTGASSASTSSTSASSRGIARAIVTLQKQVNDRYPGRSRASDGVWGDAAHQARTSDHNTGDAVDFTHDPANGPDLDALALRLLKDPRTKYVIWNRRIANPDIEAGAWRPYSGTNPHTKHLHLSVKASRRDDPDWWDIEGGRSSPPRPGGIADPPIAPAFPGLVASSAGVPAKLIEVAKRLNINPAALATVIQGESGWDPAAPRLKRGLPRGGLVQLTRGANLPGFMTDDAVWAVRSMSAEEQLVRIVEPLFARWKLTPEMTALDLYKRNFLPADINKPHDFRIGDASSSDPWRVKVYASNAGFDTLKRGYFTWDDVAAYIRRIEASAAGKSVTLLGRVVPSVAGPSSALAAARVSPRPVMIASSRPTGFAAAIESIAVLDHPGAARAGVVAGDEIAIPHRTSTGLDIIVTPGSTLAYMDRVNAQAKALNVDIASQAKGPFQQAWGEFFAGWQHFYGDHLSWFSRLSGAVYDETEKYELQVIEWRAKFVSEGGKPTAPGPAPGPGGKTADSLSTLAWGAGLVGGIFAVGYLVKSVKGG